MSESQSPALLDKDTLAEHWGAPLSAAGCPRCQRAFLIPQNSDPTTCPACFAASLEAQPARRRAEPPELAAPYRISPTRAAAKLDEWAGQVWLRPDELEGQALARRLRKTFIPMWLVDGRVQGHWQAQAGYDYQVASSQELYQSGRWQTCQLTETRIRWEPRAGQLDREYHNVPAPALEEHTHLLQALGVFDLEAAEAYSPALLNQACIRIPDLNPQEAWPLAQGAFDHRAASDCQTAAGAQHSEEFRLQAEYTNQHWTRLLLPVYATTYRDEEGTRHPILLHGQTGRIYGTLRASEKKAWRWTGGLGLAALVLFVIALAMTLASGLLPLLGPLAVVAFIFSLGVGLAAPVPAVWAWRFNRQDN